MKVIDLTHLINENIPVFTGKETPQIKQVYNVERDGFAELEISLYTHTGTHIDAPFHVIGGGRTLDQFPVEKFTGLAVLADCRNLSSGNIDLKHLKPYQDKLQQADFLILHTGWYQKWGQNDYMQGFPTLTAEAAQWLTQFELKGIGMDTISIDPVEEAELPVHKRVLKNETLIIENLTNLEALQDKPFIFSCLPLKIENADGSPVRAIAMMQ